MKKVIKYMTLIILIIAIVFVFLNSAKADSGWDTSYDSGGSWSSSWDSSYDYGSSWDNDWEWDNNRGTTHWSGSVSGPNAVISRIIIIIILMISLLVFTTGKMKYKNTMKKIQYFTNNYKEIDEESFSIIVKDISLEQMRQKAYDIYKKIQYAWSNFDYDTLRKHTTDELYNMYLSQLQTLKIKAQQNVMKDITREEIKIINIKEENNIINFQAFVKVTCYDYIIDKKNNNVLRGTDKQKLELTYLIDYVKDKNSQTKITCPNCGGEQDIITSGKCKYCDSVLVQNASDYVMSKKTIINQRRL